MSMLPRYVRVVATSFLKTLIFVWAVAGLLGIQNAYAVRMYVDVNATGSNPDGTSWAKAFTQLQNALDQAASTQGADEIWMAKGHYTPSRTYTVGGYLGGAYGRDNPTAADLPNLRTFSLPDRVTILGGFQGNETGPDKRDPVKYPTILDGGGSAYHVVTAGDDVAQTGVTATLDGLTITGGNAVGVGPVGSGFFDPFKYQHNYGGGLYIAFGSNITVQNVQFIDNRTATFFAVNAGDGAGLFANSSDVTIANSYFGHNVSGLRGGALEILNTFEGARPHTSTISKTVFDSNSTGLFGGAIVGEGTFPHPQSRMNIDQSLFVDNEAIEGGAIVFDSLTTVVQNTVFQTNHAFVNGGALSTTNVVDTIAYTLAGRAPIPFFATTIANCQFIGNVADGDLAIHDTFMFGPPDATKLDFALGGGAIVTYMNGYTDVTNSMFKNNQALGGDGGAILNGRSANVGGFGAVAYDVQTTVKNSTFIDNRAPDGNGGAIASLRDPRTDTMTNFQVATRGNTRLVVNGSNFQNNSASGNGGGMYFNFSTADFKNNSFSGNAANSIYSLDTIINGKLISSYVQ